uniref:Uncharacterized protein n=1 Tax=Panagrolaimus sp. ES5 TaxID=591445 RepID=A0AC34G1Z1_9BILA
MMCLGAATGLLGVATGGFFKNGPIIAKQYSQFVTGNVSLGLTITMLIVPFIKNGFAPNDTAEEWKNVFWFIVASLILTNVFYILFCSAKSAVWTNSESQVVPVPPILLAVPKLDGTSG